MRDQAHTIWTAAIEAVQPERLLAAAAVRDAIVGLVDGSDRVVVVGAGKAAGGMAAAVEALLGRDRLALHHVAGLVSVPEGSGRRLASIEVRETRPAGVNLPTPRVVAATQDILRIASEVGPRDAMIAVITGGGSALLAAPRPGVSLDDKITATRRLSEGGATITELNATRRAMSLVKGGGLARACTAGRLLVLVLSDVIGNPLDVIASGPCIPAETGADAIWTTPLGCRVEHLIVGDNATAVAAAEAQARRLGYEIMPATVAAEAAADVVGKQLAAEALAVLAATRRDGRPRAFVSGGEATVRLPTNHGSGGRNQQTILTTIDTVRRSVGDWPEGLLVASVGTDGEDGPTDAAGAVADAAVVAAIDAQRLDIPATLACCAAYSLFDAAGGLIRTGLTGTNVADIRIVLAEGECISM